MNNRLINYKSLLLILWTIAVTAMTLILGAVPMRAARLSFGRSLFWLVHIGLAFFMWELGWESLAGSILVLTVLVGSYREFELFRFSSFFAGLAAVTTSFLVVGTGFCIWALNISGHWYDRLNDSIQQLMDKMILVNLSAEMPITVDDLISQIPSGVMIALILALALSLIMERWMLRFVKLTPLRGGELVQFKLPDICVWFFIGSFLGSFLQQDIKWVEILSVNILNVFFLLYFFQGIAIISKFFELFRVGQFWRVVWFSLIVLKLFIAVSVLGLLDYWLDFRKRFIKKAKEMEKAHK